MNGEYQQQFPFSKDERQSMREKEHKKFEVGLFNEVEKYIKQKLRQHKNKENELSTSQRHIYFISKKIY